MPRLAILLRGRHKDMSIAAVSATCKRRLLQGRSFYEKNSILSSGIFLGICFALTTAYGGDLKKSINPTLFLLLSRDKSTCTSTSLEACFTERQCKDAGGYWNIDECSATELIKVISTTGKAWMDRNLGASKVATAYNDNKSYGDLYQWGRCTDLHEKRTSGTTQILSTTDTPGHNNFITPSSAPYDWRTPQNNYLWQGNAGINKPCPSGFRLPTKTEFEAEIASWWRSNYLGAYDSPLKLVVAGIRKHNGLLSSVDHSGFYWTATTLNTGSFYMNVGRIGASLHSEIRSYGFSVRCIED